MNENKLLLQILHISVGLATLPGEDVVSRVYILLARETKTSNNVTRLYLLKAVREGFHESPYERVPVTFTLYNVGENPDFGFFQLHQLKAFTTKTKYCNTDSAAYHELGISLPGDGKEFKCLN